MLELSFAFQAETRRRPYIQESSISVRCAALPYHPNAIVSAPAVDCSIVCECIIASPLIWHADGANFVIDALQLHDSMHLLQPIFADPAVLKVTLSHLGTTPALSISPLQHSRIPLQGLQSDVGLQHGVDLGFLYSAQLLSRY